MGIDVSEIIPTTSVRKQLCQLAKPGLEHVENLEHTEFWDLRRNNTKDPNTLPAKQGTTATATAADARDP